jgi:glycosyltransferase involved in cell wall biosynthesis
MVRLPGGLWLAHFYNELTKIDISDIHKLFSTTDKSCQKIDSGDNIPNRISILFVVKDTLPPFRSDVKALFGTFLFRLGVTSDLVGPRAGDFDSENEMWPAGAMISTGNAGGMLAEVLKSVRDLKAIFQLKKNQDIIQVRDRTFSALAVWLLARLRGKPFVYWMSFPIVEGYEARASEIGVQRGFAVWFANHLRAKVARMAYYGFIARHADHLFVQSDAMLEWMYAKGIPRERMTAVPMGVDTEALRQDPVQPADHKRLEGRRVVIYLGYLGLSRQPIFLLEVIAKVCSGYPDVLLVLAGDGAAPDEQALLRGYIDEMGLQQHVWLTGWLPQAEALRLVKRAELGLSPVPRGVLYDVSSPTKALEYLALGVPCVGNDIPDQRYVLERSGAGLCVQMTVPAFVSAIEKLLADRAYARSMGDCGPAFIAKERSYEILAFRVAKVYRSLVLTR